jgi:hypothetical protein
LTRLVHPETRFLQIFPRRDRTGEFLFGRHAHPQDLISMSGAITKVGRGKAAPTFGMPVFTLESKHQCLRRLPVTRRARNC